MQIWVLDWQTGEKRVNLLAQGAGGERGAIRLLICVRVFVFKRGKIRATNLLQLGFNQDMTP